MRSRGCSPLTAGALSQAAQQVLESQPPDAPDRLAHDALAHLGLPRLALDEDDRHLADPEAGTERAELELDLEGISIRPDALDVHPLEHLAAEAVEPARRVAHG